MGNGSLSQEESGRGVALNIHPHIEPRLNKSTAINLLPLWAFMARYRVKFTFTFYFRNLNKNIVA
jgi:hypothetical protein